MSAVLRATGSDDGSAASTRDKLERIVIKVLLAGLGLAIGCLAGIVIALTSGLLRISC